MREVYVLIEEVHSDDDRVLGVYSTKESAEYAWSTYPMAGPFYRIERREIGAPAAEWTGER